MDLGWVTTVSSPDNTAAQVTIVGNDDPRPPASPSRSTTSTRSMRERSSRVWRSPLSLRDEEWGVRRFMVREPSGTIVNVLSHRPAPDRPRARWRALFSPRRRWSRARPPSPGREAEHLPHDEHGALILHRAAPRARSSDSPFVPSGGTVVRVGGMDLIDRDDPLRPALHRIE